MIKIFWPMLMKSDGLWNRRITCSWVINVSCPAGRGDIQPQLDSAVQDVTDKYLLLEETEKQAVRKALIEERARFCIFVSMLRPVVVSSSDVCFCSECSTVSRRKKRCSNLFLSFSTCCVSLSPSLRMRRWPCWVRPSIFRPLPKTSKLWRWTPTNCPPPANRFVNKLRASCWLT